MAVSDDEICGSIGGGIMEYNLVETCKKFLQNNECKPFIKRQIHKGKIVDGSGMICSGEQTVSFNPLSSADLSIIDDILAVFSKNKTVVLSVTPKGLYIDAKKELKIKYNYTHLDDNDWSYQENLNYKDIVYIIGGGHIALATSKLLCQLGFFVTVYDDRANLNTIEKNSFADKKQIVDYKEISDYIPENKLAFVAIMTNKYTDDKLVLSKLIHREFTYIGVLGSVSKLDLMFKVLQKEGVEQTLLEKVHAPIGLKIHSQTPEEIAVSIAAQIINTKNA
jgi:xanthine dehydrogenase accessory factor